MISMIASLASNSFSYTTTRSYYRCWKLVRLATRSYIKQVANRIAYIVSCWRSFCCEFSASCFESIVIVFCGAASSYEMHAFAAII